MFGLVKRRPSSEVDGHGPPATAEEPELKAFGQSYGMPDTSDYVTIVYYRLYSVLYSSVD